MRREEQNWIAQKLEQPESISSQDKQQILEDLVVSDAFEQFLANKFPKNKVRQATTLAHTFNFDIGIMHTHFWLTGICLF